MTTLMEVSQGIPLRELKGMPPPPEPTAEAHAASLCPGRRARKNDRGERVHTWKVSSDSEQIHVCLHCKVRRVHSTRVATSFTQANVPKKMHLAKGHLKPGSVELRAMLTAMKVGESAQADHSWLVCQRYRGSGGTKCGLQNTIKDLRKHKEPYHRWAWEYVHTEPHKAVATRVK